jgi:hypothetical protein
MVVALRSGFLPLIVAGWIFTVPAMAGVPALAQPDWSHLTAQQRKILAPLAGEWKTMDSFRRKKWIGITERYAGMSLEEQARVQDRMREWAKLAPEERRLAREKFKTLKKVTPEMRESLLQNWEDYKALPEDEKQRLKKTAITRSPASTRPPPPTKPMVGRKIAPPPPSPK